MPFHSPSQTMALPSFQSDITVVPNMCCMSASGDTSVLLAFMPGASMVMADVARKSWASGMAPKLPWPAAAIKRDGA
jgi:hypothetical protein